MEKEFIGSLHLAELFSFKLEGDTLERGTEGCLDSSFSFNFFFEEWEVRKEWRG